MDFLIVISIVIGIIILVAGISIKNFFYPRQKEWCPIIANHDKHIKYKFQLIMIKLKKLKKLWFNIIFKTPKLWIGSITIILVLIGHAMDFLTRNVRFLEKPLSFYPDFMDILSIFFTWVTYFFAMIVGLFIYGDVDNLIDNNNCNLFNKIVNLFFIFLKDLLSYILPLIIIVSLISSTANSIRNESINDCPSVPGNQIDSNITNVLFIIVTMLLITSYIIFNYLKCGEITLLKEGSSFIITLVVLSFIIIGNVYLVYLTIQNYTKYLTDLSNAEEQWGYWVFFGISILIYYIQTYEGKLFKKSTDLLSGRILLSFFEKCNKDEVIYTTNTDVAPLPQTGSLEEKVRGGSKKKKK
tara:strand:+ start:1183 stop:2247 length:1065 start_codon:yes stop_codon:yes gene_type:complete